MPVAPQTLDVHSKLLSRVGNMSNHFTRLSFLFLILSVSSVNSNFYSFEDLIRHFLNLFSKPLIVAAIVNNQNSKLSFATISKFGPFDKNETSRIAGGVSATANEFPWMAFLELYTSPSSSNPGICGGTLINDYWVLTAAYCIDGSVAFKIHSFNSK